MKDFINFLLNIVFIFFGCVLKDIFKVDEFLFFIIVFWLYIITNTFINKMNLIKDYILSLLFVSIIYTFATYELSITIFSNSLQLMCGILINELNDFFTNNEIKEQ